MRIIGLDIHRIFAEAVAFEGASLRRLGKIGMTREHLAAFAETLKGTDHIVLRRPGTPLLWSNSWHHTLRAWPLRIR